MTNEPFVIERTFNAPASRVWKAISNRSQMKQWYFDLPAFEAKPGFEFEFTVPQDNKQFVHQCRVIEGIPELKLSYSWRYKGYEGNSLVTFELFDESGKTRLKLTHSGLQTFPKVKDFARENFAAGWTAISASLKGFVEK